MAPSGPVPLGGFLHRGSWLRCSVSCGGGGGGLEKVSRELNVPADRLSQSRDRVLEAGMSALKEQERDARDDEIARLKAKIGDITMVNELLYAKIDKLEARRPLARRRSRT